MALFSPRGNYETRIHSGLRCADCGSLRAGSSCRAGCGSYNQTKIDEGAGERWFTSSAEAEAAGWRKAGNCP